MRYLIKKKKNNTKYKWVLNVLNYDMFIVTLRTGTDTQYRDQAI